MEINAWNTSILRVEHPYIIGKSDKSLDMGEPTLHAGMLLITAANQSARLPTVLTRMSASHLHTLTPTHLHTLTCTLLHPLTPTHLHTLHTLTLLQPLTLSRSWLLQRKIILTN